MSNPKTALDILVTNESTPGDEEYEQVLLVKVLENQGNCIKVKIGIRNKTKALFNQRLKTTREGRAYHFEIINQEFETGTDESGITHLRNIVNTAIAIIATSLGDSHHLNKLTTSNPSVIELEKITLVRDAIAKALLEIEEAA